jgi:succinylarginine dihydrolase
MEAEEINFDGIVGPTHNYSGLSYGNIASINNAETVSNPKKAALEGLAKMHTLMSLGIKQAVLPPQERPFIPILHSLGYEGSESKILTSAAEDNFFLLMQCSSAASMWAANAVTMSPSCDSEDKKIHFTPANLITQFHRSFEAPVTGHIIHRIFDNPNLFIHHYPLPPHPIYADEGAANHTRFCKNYGDPGIQLFVYGRGGTNASAPQPKIYPARQTLEASLAIARLHRLSPERVIFAQQNPEAIDAGVFHNDVIAVGNQNVFFYHEKTFVNSEQVLDEIRRKVETHCQTEMHLIRVSEDQVSLVEAVKTYLFNSQIVTKNDGSMVLIAAQECQESPSVKMFLDELISNKDQPINQIIFQNVRESMQNGGGPACLRFRAVLNAQEQKALLPFVLLTNSLYQNLVEWVNKHYRDRLVPQDLADPKLLHESWRALDELTWLLQLGSIYPFQRMRNQR